LKRKPPKNPNKRTEAKLTKKEAAEYLKVAVRSIERYIAQGYLNPEYVSTNHGLKALFNITELDAMKQKMNEPRPTQPGIIPAQRTGIRISEFLTLTIQQAAALSRLSEEFLNNAIAMGQLKSFLYGKDELRITRVNLDKFISKL
jgi:hypothetical protein